jgi:hypothetical protein
MEDNLPFKVQIQQSKIQPTLNMHPQILEQNYFPSQNNSQVFSKNFQIQRFYPQGQINDQMIRRNFEMNSRIPLAPQLSTISQVLFFKFNFLKGKSFQLHKPKEIRYPINVQPIYTSTNQIPSLPTKNLNETSVKLESFKSPTDIQRLEERRNLVCHILFSNLFQD